MSETKHVQFGEAKQKELDNVVRKLAQGHKAAVEAELERRLSYRDEGKVRYQAYARFLLSDGHTIYVNLKTMEGSVSKKPNKHEIAHQEKREARAAKREERRAAAEQKKANAAMAQVETAGKKVRTRTAKTVKATA
jgi:hypothetical protein